MNLLRIKYSLCKTIAKHPNISRPLLQLGASLYTAFLAGYLIRGYPIISFQTIASIALGLPLYLLLDAKISELLRE